MNMKRMSKWVVAVAAAVLGVAAAHAGDSAPFALDTRTGTRIARGTEPIAYSTEWNRGADVQVFVDGELLKAATAPATGVVVWDVSEADSGVHTLTHVSGGVTLTAEFVVKGYWLRLHRNGWKATASEPDVISRWYQFGKEEQLPEKQFERGECTFYGWSLGTPDYSVATGLVEDGAVWNPTQADWNYWRSMGWVGQSGNDDDLNLYGVWGTKTTCEFRTETVDGKTEESPLGHHVQILFDDGAETPWHRGGEAVDLKPGWHSFTVRVDDGYEEQVTDWEPAFPSWLEWEWDIESSSKKVNFNIPGEYQGLPWGGEDTYSSLKLAVLLKSPAEHGRVRFACRGEITESQHRACPDFPAFNLNKVVICIQRKTSETTGGAWIDAEPWGTGLPLLPGTYRVEFGYSGSYWLLGQDEDAPGVDLPNDVQGGGNISTRGFLVEVKAGETTEIPVCYRPFGNDGLFVLVKFDGKGGAPEEDEKRYLFDDDGHGMGWSSSPDWHGPGGMPNAERVGGWQLSGWITDGGYFMNDISKLQDFLKRTKVSLTLYADWRKTTVDGGQTWQYSADGGTATVVDGPKNGAVTIPTTLDGLTVTAVGSWAFAEQVSLFALTVPDSMESIGEGAFAGCSGLASVDFGNGVATIGDGAFAGCSSLTSMTIPASVTSLGSQVFEGCSSLASLYVPAAWEGTGMLEGAGLPEGCEVVYYEQLPTFQRVTFDANGGTCELAEGVFVVGETYDELPVAAWTGHAFDGWWTARTGGTQVTAAAEVTPEGERTLYAHWKVTSWQTVTFDANGGKCGTKTKKFAVAETYCPLPTATRTGQALLGWFTAKSGGTKVTAASVVTTASKRTLYAHWTTKQTAKFDANGGACTTKSKTCTIGKAYGTLPAATQAGQAFTGWFSAKTGGSKVTASTKVTAVTPRTLYAHWTTKQKITFDANGGKCGTKSAVRAIGGTYGDLPVPTRSGQAFTGWFTAKKGGSKVAATTKVNAAAARTLHAHWTTTQTAQFDANGGTCTTKSKTYTIGKTYGTLPTATLAENGFVAWYTAKTGGSKVAASSKVTAVTPRTLYAHWTTKQKVTFNANGGKCGTKSAVRAIGGIYGDLPVLTRSGQAFTGWFTAKTGGSKVAASTKVTAVAARTLHAHWTTTQTVTFDANGGTCKTKSKNFTIAKKYGTLPTPTWKGRTFAGWFSAKTGGTKVTAASTATVVASRTLYAHWAEQTVTFDANGGTCETATAKYVRGGTYKPLPVATRQDFGFGGWWTAANGGTKVTEFTTVTSSGTRTLHAHWGEPGTKFAVCVGINKYKSGFAEDLDGCVNDATVFRRNLVTLGEWQEANTVLLLNANATKTAIRKAISNFAARAVAGDTFVYQHSSHGGQNDGTSVFICGYDSDYQDTELAADLRAFASGVKVVVVVDACNSGGLFSGASAKAVRRSAPQFDLAGRVTALMDADRHARRARGEPVAKSLSSSEIGWVTSAHWNEESMEGGYYDHPRWMTGNATTADTWDLIGGVFMTAATWGWWDGSCDTDAKAGDGDGCCDAYEFWKKGRDCAIRCGTIWDDPSMNFTPQCTNVTVLRSVELGVAGARPKSGLAGKSVRDEELGTRNAAGREFAIYSFSMDANGVATPRGGRETDGCAGTLEFVAVAGTTYELQWTAALGGEWTTVRRWVAERDGACEVALPAQEESTGFFRLAAP